MAEPWSILRRGLTGLVQGIHRVVAEVDDVGMLASTLERDPVDLVIIGDSAKIDLAPVVSGVRDRHEHMAIMVLCDAIDTGGLQQLLQAGAGAVLSKKAQDHSLLDSIGRLLLGDRVIDQRFLPLLFGGDDPESDPQPSVLTPREQEVLLQLVQGASNRQIAGALMVSEATIKTHLARIYAKLDVDGRLRAVGRAVELGLLT